QDSYMRGEKNGLALWKWLQSGPTAAEAAGLEEELGVYIRPGPHVPKEVKQHKDGLPVILINSVRPARRVSTRGQQSVDVVVELIQKHYALDPETGKTNTHRGGCTVLIDMEQQNVRYAIRKRVGNESRVAEQQAFLRMAEEGNSPYFEDGDDEPFAMVHRSV